MASLVALAWIAAAGPAAAQSSPHGMIRTPRSFDERLRAADVVGIGVIERVDPGRLHVSEVEILRGRVPTPFEIKRSPSAAPGFAPGDRAVLLLKGARSPYVMVDESDEIVRLPDDDSLARWSAALGGAVAAGDDRARARTLYLEWMRSDDAGLRQAGLGSLTDPRAGLAPSGDECVAQAEYALAPDTPGEQALAAAWLASQQPAGLDALIEGVAAGRASPQVADLTLRTALLGRSAAGERALLAALAHGDPAVRRAALRSAPILGRSPAVAVRVRALAAEDPDEEVRGDAARLSERYFPE